MEESLDAHGTKNVILNPLVLTIKKSESLDDDLLHSHMTNLQSNCSTVVTNLDSTINSIATIPKIEIKEEHDELDVEVKKERTESETLIEGFLETTSKRISRKPKRYDEHLFDETELESHFKKKKKKKSHKEKKEKKKKSKNKDAEISEPNNSEEIKVEPKFEIDLDQLVDHPIPEITKTNKCPICKGETEMNELELRAHYKQHHPGKRLRFSSLFCEPMHACDVCGKLFKTASILRDHTLTHNSYFYCPIDNHATKKLVDHIIHLGIHSENSTFQCLMCEYTTQDILKIKEHVNNHEECLKYWCEPCKKSFPILVHFQEHDNFHTGLKPFDCEFCGKCFMYSRYLHAHKVSMHKEEFNCVNRNQCPICHKEYKHRNSLKLHMNYHTGNFAVCELCGKTLCSKEKLKFHLRIHTGYKPYSCQYCGKSFTKKPILVEHIRVHTGEKPYFCDYCTKCFSQRSSLVIHMRGHTGEKPYVCEFCSKAYAAKAMLTVHVKHCRNLFDVSNLPTF